MRRFQLDRVVDKTGISGTGLVAEGVEFTDRTCAMRWCTETASFSNFASIEDVESIHGHQGATRIVWLDE